MDKLIQELITYRKQKGITQTVLAQRMGTQQNVVARVESGRSSPKLETVRKMATAMNLDIKLSVMGGK